MHDHHSVQTEVIIVGGGMAGIALSVRLARARVRHLILEAAEDVGGTWRDNVYPGAACDVPARLYSFSFAARERWSSKFAPQPEIHRYLQDVARRYRVLSRTQFRAKVTSASREGDSWRVEAEGGRSFVAQHVVFATGQLSSPRWPQLPGLEEFRGRVVHTAAWPGDLDLADAKVAVIGNGASAVQVIPAIVDAVDHLWSVQRSPSWVLPRTVKEGAWLDAALESVRLLYPLQRCRLWGQRERRTRALKRGRENKHLESASRSYMESVLNLELAARLIPDYAIGCKRVVISDDYLPALGSSKVTVVDEGIERISPDGFITTRRGQQHGPVDVVIAATGFDATHFLRGIEVRGRGNQSLHELWKRGASAYLGMTVPCFPNMFVMYGPNTNLGFGSVLHMLESQASHVVRCVQRSRKHGKPLEVRESRWEAFDIRLQELLGQTVWTAGCSAWYKDESGRVTNNWPLSTLAYRLLARYRPLALDYTWGTESVSQGTGR